MPEYLSKEEIRQWRSSLERITLEEFARRLGKVINEEKSTNDIVDKVMKNTDFNQNIKPEYQTRSEKIIVVAQQALQKERELINHISPKTQSLSAKQINEIAKSIMPKNKETAKQEKTSQAHKAVKPAEEKIAKEKPKKEKTKTTAKKNEKAKTNETNDFPFVLKKAFTQREQVVFDYLYNNKNQVVYAKDLAELLGLPRDYIYKYIKGIRAKMEVDTLSNAEKGGFVLNV